MRTTGMMVPETTVDEDNRFVTRQDDVRAAGEVPPLKSETVPQGMQKAADLKLRLGIAALVADHGTAALLGCQNIHGFQ